MKSTYFSIWSTVQHTKCIAFLDDLNNRDISPPLIMSPPSNLMSGLSYFQTSRVQLTDLSGEGGHRVEVCEVEVVDLLLRRGRHRSTSLQHHPHPKVPLLHLQVTQFWDPHGETFHLKLMEVRKKSVSSK